MKARAIVNGDLEEDERPEPRAFLACDTDLRKWPIEESRIVRRDTAYSDWGNKYSDVENKTYSLKNNRQKIVVRDWPADSMEWYGRHSAKTWSDEDALSEFFWARSRGRSTRRPPSVRPGQYYRYSSLLIQYVNRNAPPYISRIKRTPAKKRSTPPVVYGICSCSRAKMR